jgi:hypothetical protein
VGGQRALAKLGRHPFGHARIHEEVG